jgi:hypothetical protein
VTLVRGALVWDREVRDGTFKSNTEEQVQTSKFMLYKSHSLLNFTLTESCLFLWPVRRIHKRSHT